MRGVLVSVFASGVAHAQGAPSDADVERSKELFTEGRRLVDAGRCSEALPKLEESLRYNESVGVRLSLAECAKDTPLEAWRHLKLAELLATSKGDERAAFARSQLAAVEPRIALIRLELAAVARSLEGLEITVDHTPADPALWRSGTIAVAPGKHALEASAHGKRAWTRDVDAAVGVVTSVNVALENEGPRTPSTGESTPAPSPADTAPAPDGTERPSVSPVGLVVAGAGVVLLVVGGALGLSAGSKMQDSKDKHCGSAVGQTDPNRCDQAGLDLRDSARRQADLSTAFFVGGGLVTVGGAILALSPLFGGGASSTPRTTSRRVRVTAGLGSVSVGGSF
jgi:hypothetical protein